MNKSLLMIMLMSVALTVGLMVSCSNDEASTSKNKGVEKLTILMETVPDTSLVMEKLDEFTSQTGIEVSVESIGYSSMHEKLLTQMLGKTNSYDVIVVDCYWTGEFVSAGWLESLDQYILADSFDTSPYTDSMMEMVGVVDGETYMLPFYNYMMSLIYRTDVFEDAQLSEKYQAEFGKEFEIPATMEEYVEMTKFITRESGGDLAGAAMQGLRPDPIVVEWLNYLFSSGGDFYDANGNIIINDVNAVKALDLYVDNMNNSAPQGSAGFGFDEAFNVFAQGKAATYVTYNWMVQRLNNPEESSVAGTVEIVPMPGGASLNAGWGWGIPHNAPNKDASWEFIKWVESFDIAKERALAGGSPTRTDVMQDADVLAKYPHLATVQEIMETSNIIPVIEDAPQLIEVLGRELSQAVSGEKSSQEALDTVAEEMLGMK